MEQRTDALDQRKNRGPKLKARGRETMGLLRYFVVSALLVINGFGVAFTVPVVIQPFPKQAFKTSVMAMNDPIMVPRHRTRRTVMRGLSKSKAIKGLSSRVFCRLDTSASMRKNEDSSASAQLHIAAIGFFGHSGLFLVSCILVKLLYSAVSSSDTPKPQQAGIMNRCPWPFIIFHDPKQFLKDSPTWVVVVWVSLWRIIKFASKRATNPIAL
jgi:hypothetical protein